MSMNQLLAEIYGNAQSKQAQAEEPDPDVEKTAQLELFAKLAAQEGIDLSTLTTEQIQDLYKQAFAEEPTKEAQEEEAKEEEAEEKAEEKEEKKGPPPPPKKEEKEDEDSDVTMRMKSAEAEHEQMKENAAKIAEAELMGQVMAHTFVRELREIEAAQEKAASASKQEPAAEEKKEASEEPAPKTAEKVGKSSSALDGEAVDYAVKMAEAAGYDVEEAKARVNAVHTLGLGESEKVAHVEKTSEAIHVRSLEYLERAGYPVDWEQVFGSK